MDIAGGCGVVVSILDAAVQLLGFDSWLAPTYFSGFIISVNLLDFISVSWSFCGQWLFGSVLQVDMRFKVVMML